MKAKTKGDRALELKEQNLSNQQIAERLGCNYRSISTLIAGARAKRARQQQKQEEQV